MKNEQEKFWSSEFGKEYTDRNTRSNEDLNDIYRTWYGVTRLEMNKKFLKDIPKDAKILEVGCNTGMQLACLQSMGFTNLYGVELQPYAVQKAKAFTEGINVIQGSAFDLPFKDNFFDLVYTSGVLIHIDPVNLPLVFSEMYRCTSKFIWGFEYYAEKTTAINYRGNEGFLWKADYQKLMRDKFSDLSLLSSEFYPYVTENEKGNIDYMFLLKKK